jgi:hypothetical protein
MFIDSTPQYKGICSCEDDPHGNQPTVRSTHSLGLTAAIQGWEAYCTRPEYDELARETAAKEGE